MVEIFYRLNGQMTVSRSEADLDAINLQDVIWIDLLSPTGDEPGSSFDRTLFPV